MRLESPAPAPTAVPLPGTPARPNPWPADRPGLALGEWREHAVGPDATPVATEFGRGWNGGPSDVVLLATNEQYYQAHDDAIEAASTLSQGAFLGAVGISWANFIGGELHRLGVRHVMGNANATPSYEFESLAATAKGRSTLERTLKLGHNHDAVVDGAWVAVRADEAGNVDIVSTVDYLKQLRSTQPG